MYHTHPVILMATCWSWWQPFVYIPSSLTLELENPNQFTDKTWLWVTGLQTKNMIEVFNSNKWSPANFSILFCATALIHQEEKLGMDHCENERTLKARDKEV